MGRRGAGDFQELLTSREVTLLLFKFLDTNWNDGIGNEDVFIDMKIQRTHNNKRMFIELNYLDLKD